MKAERGAKSVESRLVACLAAFVVLILAIIWLLQTVFLDECYELIRRRSLITTAERFSHCLDSQRLATQMLEYCEQNGIFVRILDDNGNTVLSSGEGSGQNDLYGLSYYDMIALIKRANENGGSAFEKYTSNEIAVPQIGINEESVFSLKSARMARFEGLVYVRLVSRMDGSTAVIALNTEITPIDSTTSTLRVQLIFVSGIVLLMAIALGALLSRTISHPIACVNRAAKNLSKGEYIAPKGGRGYREINELNDTLENAARELATTENLRKELLANVSHDLRTPLTMISGYAEMMRDIPGENTPENVQIIIDESRRLSQLVNDLLDVSKYSAGIQKLSRERYNLTQDIQDTLKRYERLCGNGYQIHFESDQDVFVNADKARMNQVIYNLINNAISYTSDKTVTIRQTVQDKVVRIEVIDTGEGIPQEELPWIWDRYYKVDKTHKRAQIGTGLGLSIVKNILELHAAKFGVRSILGKGSTFWFELPRV